MHISPSTTNPISLSSLTTIILIPTYNTVQLTHWSELYDVPPRSPFKESLVAPALEVLLYQPLTGSHFIDGFT